MWLSELFASLLGCLILFIPNSMLLLTYHPMILILPMKAVTIHQTPSPLSNDQNTLMTVTRQRNKIFQKPPNQNLLGFVFEALIKRHHHYHGMLLFFAVLQIGSGFMANDPEQRWFYGTAITFIIFFAICIVVVTYLFCYSGKPSSSGGISVEAAACSMSLE